GHKLIKMEDLGQMFSALGFKNVKTLIASGNVVFEAAEKNADALTQKIEKGLAKALGYDVPVLLRPISELEALVKLNPFKKVKPSADVKLYVTFLAEAPKSKLKLPFRSVKEGFEILSVKNCDIFIVSFLKSDGHYGFPNNFIEKEFGASAT